MKSNLEDLSERLRDMENVAAQSVETEAAKVYAGSVMREVVNPLESINNLLFLLAQPGASEEDSRLYVELAQSEIEKLNEITQRTLSFCKEHS